VLESERQFFTRVLPHTPCAWEGLPVTHHKKASEVFAESNFVFSRKVSFREAFPQLESARVEVEELPHGNPAHSMKFTYDTDEIGEYIDCHNPLCYNGGFSLGKIIREMVAQRKTHLETHRLCQGYEGSPKGRRKYRDCLHFFNIRVSLTYRDEQSK